MAGDRAFDAASEDWVSVKAAGFFFEPYCTEFEPPESGEIVVLFGGGDTRHRGVEVELTEDGRASVWVPSGGRVFWLPGLVHGQSLHEPWETRLREFDYESGTWAASDPISDG